MSGRDENDMTKPNPDASWRRQVSQHLHGSVSYSASQRSSLRDSLLSAARQSGQISDPVAHVVAARHQHKPWWKRYGLDYLAVAFVAAGLAMAVLPSFKNSSGENNEALADLLSAPTMRSYPPDFDLEGDATALGDIMQDVFPAEAELPFKAEFPSHLAVKFKPTEGRFFTWAGEPGVSIRLTPTALTRVSSNLPSAAAGTLSSHATTLFIIKLNGIAEQKFPKERLVKRMTSRTGKDRRVHVWRDGNYGFAIVQNASTASGDFFPDR